MIVGEDGSLGIVNEWEREKFVLISFKGWGIIYDCVVKYRSE